MDLRKSALEIPIVARAHAVVSPYTRLEVFLAAACSLTPLLLWQVEGGPPRDSISAYFDMAQAQVFYFPLTVAAMLFLTSAFIKRKRLYDAGLGLALAVVVLFNHVDYYTVHMIAAFLFFVGNIAVMIVFSPARERLLKVGLGVVIAGAVAAWFAFDLVSLFCAEWISLCVIALHYILEALGLIE